MSKENSQEIFTDLLEESSRISSLQIEEREFAAFDTDAAAAMAAAAPASRKKFGKRASRTNRGAAAASTVKKAKEPAVQTTPAPALKAVQPAKSVPEKKTAKTYTNASTREPVNTGTLSPFGHNLTQPEAAKQPVPTPAAQPVKPAASSASSASSAAAEAFAREVAQKQAELFHTLNMQGLFDTRELGLNDIDFSKIGVYEKQGSVSEDDSIEIPEATKALFAQTLKNLMENTLHGIDADAGGLLTRDELLEMWQEQEALAATQALAKQNVQNASAVAISVQETAAKAAPETKEAAPAAVSESSASSASSALELLRQQPSSSSLVEEAASSTGSAFMGMSAMEALGANTQNVQVFEEDVEQTEPAPLTAPQPEVHTIPSARPDVQEVQPETVPVTPAVPAPAPAANDDDQADEEEEVEVYDPQDSYVDDTDYDLYEDKKHFMLSDYKKVEEYLAKQSRQGFHFVRQEGKRYYFHKEQPRNFYYEILYFTHEPSEQQMAQWKSQGWTLVSRQEAKKKRDAGWFVMRNEEQPGAFRQTIENEEEKYRFFRKYANSCRSTMFLLFVCMAVCAVMGFLQYYFQGYLAGIIFCIVLFLVSLWVFMMYGRMLAKANKQCRLLKARLRLAKSGRRIDGTVNPGSLDDEGELDMEWDMLDQNKEKA